MRHPSKHSFKHLVKGFMYFDRHWLGYVRMLTPSIFGYQLLLVRITKPR